MQFRHIAPAIAVLCATATAQGQGAATGPATGAQAAAAASAPVVAAAKPSEAEPLVCRSERPMGSLIPKRICKTAAQWDAERDQSRKMIQDMQQRTGSTSGR